MVAHSPRSSAPPAARIHALPAADSPPKTAARSGLQPDPQPPELPPETHSPDFAPRDPRQIETILELFTDPDLSLRDIADQNNTTLQALTLWLARPEITEQLLDLECASVRRARFNISFALPKIANALSKSLDQATTEAEHLDHLANNFPCFTLRLRYRENIRKSVAHLLRISGFDPTAKHRSESERRRRDEQTARWREHCGLSMLDQHSSETPDSKSNAPPAPHSHVRAPSSSSPHSDAPAPRTEHPQSETPNPKSSPSSHPPSDVPHPTSPHYMIISADEHGNTNIRGLRIPPELNQPGQPFTPVFDDPSDPFVPSVLSTTSNSPEKSQAPDTDDDHEYDHDDDDDDADQHAPFDFSSFSILSTRILAALDLLGSDLTDVEVAHGMIMVQNAVDELGEEIVGLPLEEIAQKVGVILFEGRRQQCSSSQSRGAPPASSA